MLNTYYVFETVEEWISYSQTTVAIKLLVFKRNLYKANVYAIKHQPVNLLNSMWLNCIKSIIWKNK